MTVAFKLLAQVGPTFCKLENYFLNLIKDILWREAQNSSDPKKILIHRVGKIGDIVCALPAIRAVRARWPNSQITLLTNESERSYQGLKLFLMKISWIDEIIFYRPSELNRPCEIKSFATSLSQKNIDLWLSLPQDLTSFFVELRNMLFAKYVNSKNGFGFRVNTVKLFSFYQAKFIKHKYEVNRLIEIVGEIGIENACIDYGIAGLKMADTKNEFLEIVLDLRESLLIIAPGGNRISNRWPSMRFADVAKRWVDEGGKVAFIGGSQDASLAEEIIKNIPGQSAINLCGITTLEESLNLLKNCKIFLSNDSGPIHLAAANKTPMVTIFSARDFPGKWFPKYEGSFSLRDITDCSPCFLEVCNRNNKCLANISVDDVWNAIKEVELIGRQY